MNQKSYNIELSVEGLEKASEIVKNIQESTMKVKRKLLQAYANYMLRRMKVYAPKDTGNLKSSFKKEMIDLNVIEVYADEAIAEYAKYVEFGTGIVGSEHPHAEASNINWEYDYNHHGEKGWYYMIGDEKHWTKGQVAKEFMYKAYQDLEKNYYNIAIKIFKEEGLI